MISNDGYELFLDEWVWFLDSDLKFSGKVPNLVLGQIEGNYETQVSVKYVENGATKRTHTDDVWINEQSAIDGARAIILEKIAYYNQKIMDLTNVMTEMELRKDALHYQGSGFS